MKLNNKIYLMGLIASAVLSSCGRNDYNGTYSGTTTSGQSSTTSMTQTQQYPYTNGTGYASSDTATLTLNQNGEQVQGNYTSGSGETGTFYANARSSNRLDSVQLNIQYYQGNSGTTGQYQNMQTGYAAYCAGSFYTGSLNAPDDARQIEGTLSASSGMAAQNYQCQSKTFRLFKNGNSR